jgi:hypothetical protein
MGSGGRPEHGDRSVEEEARQSDELQPRHCGRQPLVILDQPPKRDAHANSRSSTHRLGKSTKPRLASGRLTTSGRMLCSSAASADSSPEYP